MAANTESRNASSRGRPSDADSTVGQRLQIGHRHRRIHLERRPGEPLPPAAAGSPLVRSNHLHREHEGLLQRPEQLRRRRRRRGRRGARRRRPRRPPRRSRPGRAAALLHQASGRSLRPTLPNCARARRLVHDRHCRRLLGVGRTEPASRDQGNAHGVEVIAPDESPADLRRGRPGGRAVRPVDARMSSTSSRSSAGGRSPDGDNAGKGADAFARSAPGTARRCPSVRYLEVVCSRNVSTPAGTNPGSTLLQVPERSQHQGRPRCPARARAPPARPRARPAHAGGRACPWPACCRSSGCNPGRMARSGRDERHDHGETDRRGQDRDEHHTIERDLGLARHLRWNPRHEQRQRASTPVPSPASDPMAASTACSTSSCRTSSPRDAPTAVRTASSRTRSIDRPSTSVPRFTPPSSRMKPTAPSRSSSAGRTLPVIDSCKALARRVWPQSLGLPHLAPHLPSQRRELPGSGLDRDTAAKPRERERRLSAGTAASRARTRHGDPQIRPPAEHLDAVGHHADDFVRVPDRRAPSGRARRRWRRSAVATACRKAPPRARALDCSRPPRTCGPGRRPRPAT